MEKQLTHPAQVIHPAGSAISIDSSRPVAPIGTAEFAGQINEV
jgi:hypothetical protein